MQAASRAMHRAFGAPAVFVREGGSIPIVATVERLLGVPAVLMGVGLQDDNLHAPNEKLDLDQFYGGIEASAFLMEELGGAGTGAATLNSAGSIREAGVGDAAADILGSTVNLTASSIGALSNTLEIAATTLNAATAGGDTYLNDTAGGVAVGLITAGAGDVDLTAKETPEELDGMLWRIGEYPASQKEIP